MIVVVKATKAQKTDYCIFLWVVLLYRHSKTKHKKERIKMKRKSNTLLAAATTLLLAAAALSTFTSYAHTA